MEEVRCTACRKKLAEAAFSELRIKCPRCGAHNVLRVRNPDPERPGASFHGDAHVGKSKTAATRP
ncbi:MAG: Com family DNA-binding transcriptional regulator [Betaproteobacteria bacterium]|nr:Com family DNA-binding transcriptional regulator [Betaproteobacteria bacterium]